MGVINIEDINYRTSKERMGGRVSGDEERRLVDNLTLSHSAYYTAKSSRLLAKPYSYVMLWTN